MTPGELEPLEAAALDLLLAGDHPVLVALRAQLATASVSSRELSGVSFFTDFALPDDVVAAPIRNLRFGDVHATIVGLEHGADFVLLIKDGRLATLEGFAFDEPWPERVAEFAVDYWDPGRQKLAATLGAGLLTTPT